MIIGRVFILLGVSSFVLTLVSNYFDILLQIENKFTSRIETYRNKTVKTSEREKK